MLNVPAGPGRLARLRTYIAEMYPLGVNVPFSFMSFYGYYFLLLALHGETPLRVSLASLLGALTLVAFALLLRVYDEFKDYEADRVLFPDRPLPSGRVLKSDLLALGWGLVALMTSLNLVLGGWALAGYLGLMAYGALTLRYFFLPRLHAKSLLLTVATHNPVVVASHLYVAALFIGEYPGTALSPLAWFGIGAFWPVVFAWEVSRKVRAPEQENDYVTYSRIFGPRRAAAIALTAVSLSGVLAGALLVHLGVHPAWLAVLTAGYAYAAFAFVRFLRAPTAENAVLKPRVEAYGLVLYLAVLAALVTRFGVGLGAPNGPF